MPDIPTVLSTLRMEVDDELAPLFYTLEDLWERKLWHQLTGAVVELFKDERSRPVRFQLFNQFVSSFENQINKLAYVTLGIAASESLSSEKEALQFLETLATSVDKEETREVYVFAQLRVASLLKTEAPFEAKKLIDYAGKKIEELQITDNAIIAAYYGVSCEYYKIRADYTNYYRSALLYLACIKFEDLPETVQVQRAYDLAISALLADEVYNFGELILHPILKKLDGEYQWLQDLVLAVHGGHIAKLQEMRPQLAKAPLLEAALPFLEQKICLTAFSECVFRRPTSDRILTFDTIARETFLHAGSKVEILVLKAFSLGLVKGSIDQVNRTVNITWLQPRVLTREQMETMADKLKGWEAEVEQLGQWMQAEGKDVWVK